MMTRTGKRMRRVKKLARVGIWIAVTAQLTLTSVSTAWMLVAAGSMAALAAVSVTAAVLELRAEGRWVGWRRKGNALSGRGRDDDGPAGKAVRWRHTLAVLSRLMPVSAGRRWLAEAQSVLAEVTAARRGAAVRSYLLSGAPAGGDDVGT